MRKYIGVEGFSFNGPPLIKSNLQVSDDNFSKAAIFMHNFCLIKAAMHSSLLFWAPLLRSAVGNRVLGVHYCHKMQIFCLFSPRKSSLLI